MKRNLS